MSQYYSFYVGLKDKTTGKIEGYEKLAYDLKDSDEGDVTRFNSIYYRSRSFMPHNYLEDNFHSLSEEDLEEKTCRAFQFRDMFTDKLQLLNSLCYISYAELMNMNSNFIKTGYFLVDDVEQYQKTKDSEDLFYDSVSESVYANMCAKKIESKEMEDDEGFKYTKHGWEDYMYFAYPDYDSPEYLTHILQILADSYHDLLFQMKDKELVILAEDEY